MNYTDSDKLIFILASPAGGGYRLGRILCCFDNVFWYEAIRNGKYPWRIFPSDVVKGKDISSFHFDRRTATNMIPLVGERIERFWNTDDLDTFYSTVWNNQMTAAGADNIINSNKSLVWVLHDTADYVLSRFPNAKVINLVDSDIEYVIDRYLKTTALFPITIENKNLKPLYINDHAMLLDELVEVRSTTSLKNIEPTYRDFWAWENKQQLEYTEDLDDEYKSYVSNLLTAQHAERIKESPSYINVTWDNLDIDLIKSFINATAIDENYKLLLKN
jgi:hypothetical protein